MIYKEQISKGISDATHYLFGFLPNKDETVNTQPLASFPIQTPSNEGTSVSSMILVTLAMTLLTIAVVLKVFVMIGETFVQLLKSLFKWVHIPH